MDVVAISDRADFAGRVCGAEARVCQQRFRASVGQRARACLVSHWGSCLGVRAARRRTRETQEALCAFEIQMPPRQDRWRWSSRSLLELPSSRDGDQSTLVAAPIIGFGTVSSGPHLRPRYMCLPVPFCWPSSSVGDRRDTAQKGVRQILSTLVAGRVIVGL